jgi:hypothetical protein
MLNYSISDDARLPGRDARRTRIGQSGHVVYGPYRRLTHGVYQVEFELSLTRPAQEGSHEVCATVDVTTDFGNRCLVDRPIRQAELSTDARRFALLFVLRDIEVIEYRVHVAGIVELLVGSEPVFTRISGILDQPPGAGLPFADDPVALARDTRRILGFMTPSALVDHRKIRLGNDADGGYVCIDDLDGVDTAFSFGINDDISWDRAVADRGLMVYQFDHTVTDPAPDDPRMVFEAKRIDVSSGPDSQSLSDLIRRHDRGGRPNIILKMDIEAWEWNVFDATPEDELARIAWIACELHYFQGLADPRHRALADRCLAKLNRAFAAVHVHANVWGGLCNLANIVFPDTLEVTFANRARYRLTEGRELFPSVLDNSCDPDTPDFYLGNFRF